MKHYLHHFRNLVPKVYRDWTELNNKLEYEYRKEIPEAKVVNAIRAFIDGEWAPKEEHTKLWQNVLASIRDLDESELVRIEQAQKRYEQRFGKVSFNALETIKKEDNHETN